MMADITVGHIKKLNNHNFSTWQSCMEPSLECHDLLEYVTGNDATPPPGADATTLRKWKIHIQEPETRISCAVTEEKTALFAKKANQVDFRKVWIVSSGTGNHMTSDKEKLHSTTEYMGGLVVVTIDNTKLPIKHIGDTVIMP
ncbi:hypothetical protein ACH5RR_015326 [Cinchona calisaya]|uniref:Uncharacterized protein n=1 Tax=Cinchona calisaya TaxID=153742 RepID=A0ABD2ZST5_9GENT